MSKPLVLVITPTLGTRESLAQTILSVRLYGGSRVNHVLVGPICKLSSYKKRYPWVEILEQTEKKGVYPALNHAIATYANYFDYFAYINDDDSWSEGFSVLLSSILKDRSLDVVYGRVFYGSIGNVKSKGSFFPIAGWFSQLASKGIPFITQQALVIKTSLIIQFNGFDENYPLTADSMLWSKVFSSRINVKPINLFCAYYELDGQERLSLNADYISRDSIINSSSRRATSSIALKLKILIYRLYNLPLYFERFADKIFNKFRRPTL